MIINIREYKWLLDIYDIFKFFYLFILVDLCYILRVLCIY